MDRQFRYIERQLYAYPEARRRLDNARQDILLGTRHGEVRGATGPGDSTGARGVSLATLAEGEPARWVACIEAAILGLTDLQAHILRRKYLGGEGIEDICEALHIGRSTYFLHRERAVMAVALEAAKRGLLG